MGRELSPDEVDRVTAALYAGRKIEAIKLYRGASGDGLATAKQVVEGIEARLRAESPEKFSTVSQPAMGRIVFAVVTLAMAVGVVMVLRPGVFRDAKEPVPRDARVVPVAKHAEVPPAPAQAGLNAGHEKPLADAAGDKLPPKPASKPAKAIPKLPKLVDSTLQEAAPFEGDLTGAWLLRLPGGKERPFHLARADATHFRLEPSGSNFSGLYEVRGGRLVMEKPVNPRAADFEWSIRDGDHLRLVVAPAVGLFGPNYLGATLTRQGDAN